TSSVAVGSGGRVHATTSSSIRPCCPLTCSSSAPGLAPSTTSTTSDRPPVEEPSTMQDPSGDALWYKDAIIYQVHVRAFADSDADGIGDFQGITSRLDYVHDLGATA